MGVAASITKSNNRRSSKPEIGPWNDSSKGMLGFGFSNQILGDMMPLFSTIIVFTSPAILAARSRWPTLLLTVSIKRGSCLDRYALNIPAMAPALIGFPTGVPVL